MTIVDLQNELKARGFYTGAVDGQYGPGTRGALLACLKAGPDTPLQPADVAKAAAMLRATTAHVRTVVAVEAAGAGFQAGLPKILFEGHIFSRLTRRRFDRTHRHISYPNWDKSKYPGSQDGRYAQLLDAVALDPDAAFASASYGAFQILGQNYKVCGYRSEFEFVLSQCQNEGNQLMAFVNFVKGNRLDDELRSGRWAAFARGYNGSAYKANQYDLKLAAAFARESRKPEPVIPKAPAVTGVYRVTTKLNVRDNPNGNVKYVLPSGCYVNLLIHNGSWSKVNYAKGHDGWVMTEYLAKV